jgi:hypothetical protein
MNTALPGQKVSAFTLVEIIVAISLLTFIIVGLMATFEQVQRSFKSSVNQSDVLEPGRAVVDMMTRDLEQMTPAQLPPTFMSVLCPNFTAQFSPLFSQTPPMSLPSPSRTNVVQDIFFMSRINQDWAGTGYTVSNAVGGAGTLYRYYRQIPKLTQMTSTNPTNNPAMLFSTFLSALPNPAASMGRIAEGVVHLQVRAFDTRGNLISSFLNIIISASPNPVGQPDYSFYSNAVPAYLELEVGMLEPQILDRAKGMADPKAYLANNAAAHVQIFRQRIPIRNVDPSVYP